MIKRKRSNISLLFFVLPRFLPLRQVAVTVGGEKREKSGEANGEEKTKTKKKHYKR